MLDPQTIAFAHRLADEAGNVIRPCFRRRIEVIDKGKSVFDPVTAADRGAEEAIRTLIERERPDDAIVGEEYGVKRGTSGRTWVLDPVDGTRAFITGRHTWGTLIALEEDGRRVLGIIDQPVLGERFIGYDGASALITDGIRTPLKTRGCEDLSVAVVSTTHPWGFPEARQRDAFERLCGAARMSYMGGDCYAYALLAMGFIDVIVEASLKHWDVAALEPVIVNAGGIVTDWKGKPLGAGGNIIAAGDPRVHAEAVRMLEGVG
jgi:histidinol phosphatase-like enzyme (inositol monophosphatase family)